MQSDVTIKHERRTGANRLERVNVRIFEDSESLSKQVADRIAELIRSNQNRGRNTVLGLPTGSTPISVYHELVRMHREEGLDFGDVITFNLDEYYPMAPDSLQSYHRFMYENFFDHVNLDRANIHIPSGSVDRRDVESHCEEYELAIRASGGIDLMLLGIGRSGHVGFNEPGSSAEDRTRLIVLDEITRKDAASDFFEEKYVPREAITMGVGTIIEAREIILMATGEHKAPIVRRAVEEKKNNHVSATYLQDHQNASFFLDSAAASDLTREQTPWLVSTVDWDFDMATRAVIWLSEQEAKAIPHLEAADFQRHHLHDLAHLYDGVDELCLEVFETLRRKILYAEELPKNKKVIVFSPHPDDDVISMGGMLGKLVSNGNDVTVAYMTNGSVAVFDQDVTRHLRFVEMTYSVLAGAQPAESFVHRSDEILEFLEDKAPGQVDSEAVQKIKAFI
ncbi:MAG: glucosamine-6-phosphate deaminase, partial [Rhodothermales bacterium]|nr:glucosamine-6-phosphate deaminase [Rhodothermales bacterium]